MKHVESNMKAYAPSQFADIPFTDLLTWTFGNGSSYDVDKPILIDAKSQERSISYNQAKNIVRLLIGGFKKIGVKPGDGVCLHSTNNINYALVFLAVIGAGGQFVGSNPSYTLTELAHLFTSSGVKFVIAEEEFLKTTRAAAELSKIAFQNLFVFDTLEPYEGEDFRSWNVLLDSPESDWIRFDDEHKSKNTVAALMSTSGTTGLPKFAQTSHYAQVSQSILLQEFGKPYEVVRFLCLPQYHGFSAPLALIAPIKEGHTTYVMKRYKLDEFLDYLWTIEPTEVTVVNPIIYKLLELKKDERAALKCLRTIWCGGVKLHSTVQNAFAEIIHPDASVKQVWGLTEVGWATTFKFPEKDATGSVGRLLPNVEARIIDEHGVDLHGENARGEILLRGPSMMMGYRNNEEANETTIINGWLHTGDIGYQNKGKWYIVDRIKELIKVRGWQVSPAELEMYLITHPAIVDVAVIGVDLGDKNGELPRAYVVLDPLLGPSTTDLDIQEYLVGKLSHYKYLRGGVRRMESLPRSSTGKVLKNVLRREAKQEVLEAKVKDIILSAEDPVNLAVTSMME